ncbi:G patch domain-containing protein 1 [Perkinsus olseni]|uniref:G patch domain-containing protein 1 n=2 Tax=Perkinsus olseni TaxID=32597 RepID=A0A7J6M4Y7_PEROL|nr:G patch domain-containing protein 1 [Perkinsus olseni]
MTDSSTSPSVRMPPGYGNPRSTAGGGGTAIGDPSEASRLLDGCHQIMVAMSSPAIFENTKERAFQTFRRGCLDLKKDISATEGLESTKIDDWMIENCWLFLFELAKARLRRKHILECMEILCTSDRWKSMLDDNDRVRAKMAELDDTFIHSLVSEFHVKPFPPKPAPAKPKPTSSFLNRRNRSNNRQTSGNRDKWETGSATVKTTASKASTPSLQRGRSASLGALDVSDSNQAESREGSVKNPLSPSGRPDAAASSHGSWSIEEVEEGDLANQDSQPVTPPSPVREKPTLSHKTSVVIIDKSRRGSGASSKHSTTGGSPTVADDHPKLDTNPFRNPKLFEDSSEGITDDDTVSVDEWWKNPAPALSKEVINDGRTAGKGDADASAEEVEMLQKQQEMILDQQQQLIKAIQDIDHAIARDLRANGALVVDLDLANRDILQSIVGLLKEAPTIYQLLLYSGTYFFGHQPAYKDQVKSLRRRLKYTLLTETDLVRQLVQSVSTYLQSSKMMNNVLVIDLTGVPLKPISSSSSRNAAPAAGLSGVLRTAVWKSSGPLEDLIQGLKCCRRLQRLSLANCQFTDTGLQLLAPIVGKELPRLTSLGLARNRLMRPARALRNMLNLRNALVVTKKVTPISTLDLGKNPLGCAVLPDFNRLETALVGWCALGDIDPQPRGLTTLILNGCRLERVDGIIKALQQTIERGKEKENGSPSFVLPRIRDININNNPSLPEGTQALLTTLLADLAELRGDAVVDQARLGLPKADTTTIRRLDHLTLRTPLRKSNGRKGTSGSSTKSEPDTDGRAVDDARLAALQEYFPVVRDAISEGDPHDVDEGSMVESQSSAALRSEYMQDLHTLVQRINNKYPIRPKSDVISDLKASSGEESPTTLPADQTPQYSPSVRDGLPRDIMNASYDGESDLVTPKGSSGTAPEGSPTRRPLLWSPSAVWPWTAASFNAASFRSPPPPPLYSSSDEDENSSNSSTSPPSSSSSRRRVHYHARRGLHDKGGGATPSPHTRLLLRDARDRITTDYMLLLRASENGGSLPPLVLSSGLSRHPVVKTARSWRVEAQHDTAVQKTLDRMRIRQAEFHRKLEAAITTRAEQQRPDRTCEKLHNLLRQLQGLSDKVEEASAMIEQRWRGRIAWQRQKRVDAAIAKAARKRKLAFQKGGILNRNDSLLESVREEDGGRGEGDYHLTEDGSSNTVEVVFGREISEDLAQAESLLALSEDHWSFFEQYLLLDIDLMPRGDVKRKRTILARSLMDLHRRAIVDIQKLGGCSEALLMLIEEELSLTPTEEGVQEKEDMAEYYDEEHQVLAKYGEVLGLAAQRMHVLLCTMKALTWERGLRRQDSNTRRQMLSPFEEEMNQWFDSELDIAKLSAQEYSNLCINHIRDLLSSVDAHRKPSALLAEVEAAAEAYRQRLAALSEFLKYPEAPVGEEGLPVLWLLHELEQFRRQPLTHVDIDEIDRIQQEEQSAGHSHTTTGLLLTSKQRQTINASRPWEQVVTDDQGRRRFHGAFTGGFSAGKNDNKQDEEEEGGHDDGMKQQRHQRISDFMDEEDYNDGIGADDVAAVGGSSSSGGFAWRRDSGEVEVKERVGLAIMRSQGWREGMLVGEVSKLRHHRQSPDADMNSEPSPPQANDRKRKVYTVSSLPPQLRAARRATGNTTDDYDDDGKEEEVEEEQEHRNIVAVHRSIDRILHNHKDDMHGIGYSGALRAGNTAGGPSTTGANELLSSIFGPGGESGGTRQQQQQHGSSNRQQQQQKRSSSTQAVGAFGIGVFDQEEGGDGYDVEVYNDYDMSIPPTRGDTPYSSRYATTVVEIDDDDDDEDSRQGKSATKRRGDNRRKGAEVINLIDDDDDEDDSRSKRRHESSSRREKRHSTSQHDDTLNGMFTTATTSVGSSSTAGSSSSFSEDALILSKLIPEPPRVPRGFKEHLHVSRYVSGEDVFRDASPEYQRLVEWLEKEGSSSSSSSQKPSGSSSMTMTERTAIISGKSDKDDRNRVAPDDGGAAAARSAPDLEGRKTAKGGDPTGKALWSNVNDEVRREALLAAVGGRTIRMHKATTSTTTSSPSLHDTSPSALEALNSDPDKRRRYEVFCTQMASGAPTLSAHGKVDFKELKEFTKIYETSRRESEGDTADAVHEGAEEKKKKKKRPSAAEVADALRKLQPSRVECNWKAEPLVCKRFGCPDPWRHKKFYDDSDILGRGKKSRWAGGDRRSRRNNRDTTTRSLVSPGLSQSDSKSVERSVESPQARADIPPDLPLPTMASKRPPDDLFADIFGG